jgi:hypothetical protein
MAQQPVRWKMVVQLCLQADQVMTRGRSGPALLVLSLTIHR